MSEQAPMAAPRPAPWALEARLTSWAERLSDRVNPLVVKEIRQGLRTRIFWITFSTLLLACVMISLVAYITVRDAHSGEADGRGFFFAFFMCLGVVQLLVLPYTAYRSLARELEDETWVLLSLTGLGPRRILRGKLGSSLVQGALYGSAILPFILLSYFLNGVSLLHILLVVALSAVLQLFLAVVGVCAATLAGGRVSRALINVVMLGVLLGATAGALFLGAEISTELQDLLRDQDFYLGLGLWAWGLASTGWFLFEVAAARLSLQTESYTRGPRLALLAQVLSAMGLWGAAWLEEGRALGPVLGLQTSVCLYLAFIGMFMASDVDGQAVCHRAKKGPGRLFTPGALRGFRFIVLLLLFTTLVAELLLSFSKDGAHGMQPLWTGLLAAPGYVLLYLSLPILVGRALPLPRLGAPNAVRLLTMLIVVLASGGPPLLAAVLRYEPRSLWLNLFNPVVGMRNLLDSEIFAEEIPMALLVLGAGALAALLADAVLARRDREPARA